MEDVTIFSKFARTWLILDSTKQEAIIEANETELDVKKAETWSLQETLSFIDLRMYIFCLAIP